MKDRTSEIVAGLHKNHVDQPAVPKNLTRRARMFEIVANSEQTDDGTIFVSQQQLLAVYDDSSVYRTTNTHRIARRGVTDFLRMLEENGLQVEVYYRISENDKKE